MYKILNIGEKDYKLEFTIEASLYGECTEKLINFMGKTMGAAGEKEFIEGLTEQERDALHKQIVANSISGISNMPDTGLTLFYAGLMEHHGEDGDKTIMTKQDAKRLLKQYFSEHTGDGTDNFYDLVAMLMEQMGEDGFFQRTGLEKMLGQNGAEKGNRQQRRAAAKASGSKS